MNFFFLGGGCTIFPLLQKSSASTASELHAAGFPVGLHYKKAFY